MKKVAYMRVSTSSQKFDSQYQQLLKFGFDKLYKEKISSRAKERSQLKKALSSLQPGDMFIVYKLDRIARSTKELLTILEFLNENEITFVCISDNIDTSSAMGKFFFTIIGAFAEMEASMIRERIRSGLVAARKNGTQLGRPKLVKQTKTAIRLLETTDHSIKNIAAQSGLGVSTVYKLIKTHNIKRTTTTFIEK